MGCASGACCDNNEQVYFPIMFPKVIHEWFVFMNFLFLVSWENMSLVYVNSMNWTVRLAIGDGGGLLWYGSPLMQSRSGFSLALQ